MHVSRREMLLGLAGTAAIGRASASGRVFERRVYSPGSVLPPDEALERSGIHPAWVRFVIPGTEYRIPFASPESRAQAWDRFNSDPEWCALRDRGKVLVAELEVYPGGKIFEMSL